MKLGTDDFFAFVGIMKEITKMLCFKRIRKINMRDITEQRSKMLAGITEANGTCGYVAVSIIGRKGICWKQKKDDVWISSVNLFVPSHIEGT